MNLFESIRIAFAGLNTNRLRAVLTTLGIVIGVGAVIALVSLGRAVEDFVAAEFESLGSNVLFVFSSRPASPTRTRIEPLTTREAAELSNPAVAPSIRQIAMEYSVFADVVSGSERTSAQVSGITPNYTDIRVWYPQDGGSFITEQDLDSNSRVAVLGTAMVEELFGSKDYDALGKTLRINNLVFTIVGVMTEGSEISGENDAIFIPLTTAQTRLDNARARDGGYRVSVLHVEARAEDLMDSAMREIDAYLSEAHNISFDGEQDYQIINQADVLSVVGQITGILTVFLSLIAGVSLLVGGIGIMNIMLVSVTERTREIGLRKAVGARGSDILMQFLVESITLSIVGGLVGVGLGWLGTVIGSALIPDLNLALTADAIILATAVSSFVGVFFGLYPASRAARMRPIDALRFE